MSFKIIDNKHIHGKILRNYTAKQSGETKATFDVIFGFYESYRNTIDSIESLTEMDLYEMVKALNGYRQAAIPVFDSVDHSGQSGLGSTIMEEFFYLLFQKQTIFMGLSHANLFVGKGNSYVSLSFAPNSFASIFNKPNTYVHTKDQDFVLGANIEILVASDGASERTETVIPVIAIECKTYLERNMLDTCAATASRLKKAMPYCVFIVVAEYMKMSDASPELTDIDEVYVLCKAKNTEREQRQRNGELPHDIQADLIIDLYNRVTRHLNAIWWSPENAVEHGKIINRPR